MPFQVWWFLLPNAENQGMGGNDRDDRRRQARATKDRNELL